MANHFTNIQRCRICGCSDLIEVIKIEEQHLSPTFVISNENNKLSDLKVTQTLLLCDKSKDENNCGLLQLKETVKPDLLYKQYFYRSAVSDTMRKDLKDVVSDVTSRVSCNPGEIVVDIGANDCTMLSYFPEDLRRVGVEPAENINWSHVNENIRIVNDYFSFDAVSSAIGEEKVKIFTSCAMFYDLDDPNSFVKDIKKCLDKDGVWCIQLSYLPLMLENINFYDICNEHLEYYSLQVLNTLMKRNGLKIVDASTNNVNGGSARVFIKHIDHPDQESQALRTLLEEEDKLDLYNPQTYVNFYDKIKDLRDRIKNSMLAELNKGEFVIGLGASTKGNMLLQLFGIDKQMLPYISERNPDKVGLKTLGTDIELISEEHARSLNPSCMLVLPWYFKDEIVEREKEYIQSGGKLLFPMPYPHLVTKDGEIEV
tara:strand:+ start:1587 stop:2870 length:1284 start_codon:yes stop_codon:yes gene_type:complete